MNVLELMEQMNTENTQTKKENEPIKQVKPIISYKQVLTDVTLIIHIFTPSFSLVFCQNLTADLDPLLSTPQYARYVCLFVCLFVLLFVCLFVCLFVVCLFVCLFVVCLFVCLFVCCLFVCLFIYLFVCLFTPPDISSS